MVQSLEDLLAKLPRTEQVLVRRLRALIIECIPKATEKFYYDIGLPFYRYNKLICFIYPNTKKGTALGFNQGYLMSNDNDVLLAEGRKQVYQMYFKTINDIDEQQVKSLLYEAAMIDDEFGKKKKRSTRSSKK